MKTSTILSLTLAAATLIGTLPTARADSTEAMCEVRKDGDTKKKASGPCSFSQRQGYIDLDLRNGVTHSLSPGNKADHYKDQKGNKVVRTRAGGNTQEFKWEGGTKIIVTFVSHGSGHGAAHPSHGAGKTVPDLADLVGARAGQAEGARLLFERVDPEGIFALRTFNRHRQALREFERGTGVIAMAVGNEDFLKRQTF